MSGIGQETRPVFCDWLKALPDLREWLGDPSGCPAVVGRPFQMSGRSRDMLPNVWSAFSDVREWLGGLL